MTEFSDLLDRVQSTASTHPALGARAKLDLGAGGSIVIDGTAGANAVAAGDGAANVVLSMKPDVLAQLLDGTLDPTVGYMMGKLKVNGDMAVALKVAGVLGD